MTRMPKPIDWKLVASLASSILIRAKSSEYRDTHERRCEVYALASALAEAVEEKATRLASKQLTR